MAVETSSNSNSFPQKSRYALTAILFITLFLFTIFVFTKRALEPSLFFYKDLFSQIPSSSSSSSSANHSLVSLPHSTSAQTVDPPSSLLQSTPTQSIQEPNSQSELKEESNDENVQDPDRENESSELKESNDDNGQHANENPDGEMGEIPCDLYVGTWVKDEQYPHYKPGSCPYVDEAFDCQSNGRSDSEYLKWRWKPDGCDLPRYLCPALFVIFLILLCGYFVFMNVPFSGSMWWCSSNEIS